MYGVSKESAEFMIRVIRTLLGKYPVSDKFLHCNNQSEFYEDSVKVLALRAELLALASGLQTLVRFMDLAE